uniref:IrrE N-terminal-like domain-containing protein n=1 Tax=Candidatus Kentrum eta TaxID=2126337 RepID=A0A450UDR3_9GAMM|nr:MAG: protein of unknown function (DUF955) [Candidatus Kentron sp. H]VFJ91759.1 MAG: protein of unknown function (DUF955) [Candidatus Kentron sp. H]VFJ98389.1 MAG: protein of unknown function (DUF955) [Candidatus Kentron sp. H]
MAQRLLARHALEPPFDLDGLVEKYAVIDRRRIPFSADGISISIDGTKKPEIIINTIHPKTRQKFTLAHELGHIIIPWHTGTILSHTTYLGADVRWEYREMESEANRFAAELLLPTRWIGGKFREADSISEFLHSILSDSGASKEAAFIKVFDTLESRIVLAELDENNECVKPFATRNAPYTQTLYGIDLINDPPFATESKIEEFNLYGKHYISWEFIDSEIELTDHRPWRDVLDQIMMDCDAKNIQPSINAVLPAVYQMNKEKPIREICSKVIMAYEGRDKFKYIINHALFSQYVIKRVNELSEKNKI